MAHLPKSKRSSTDVLLSLRCAAPTGGGSFEQYRTLESLREYLLVSQDRPRVEQYLRQDGNLCLFKDVAGLDQVVSLPSLRCELALAEIYDKVAFA